MVVNVLIQGIINPHDVTTTIVLLNSKQVCVQLSFLFKVFQCRTVNNVLEDKTYPVTETSCYPLILSYFQLYICIVLLSIAAGQCLMSFLLSVTFCSSVYSVTLYFHGFNEKFSCVNNLHNLKERFLTSFYSKKD